MLVRNESQIIVQWPESEPLRPGCVIVDDKGEPLPEQPSFDPPVVVPAYIVVRNEDATIVTWPSSEPLRPGCEVVTNAFLVQAAQAAVDLDKSIATEDTSAEASAKFADAAASAAVDSLKVARKKAPSVAPATTASTDPETK